MPGWLADDVGQYSDGSSRVRVPKAAELVANELRRQVVRGEIEEGTGLDSEAGLMQRFGVSRPTLREAFRILESEGLISVVRGARGGARVHLPDISVAAKYAGQLLQVRGTTLGDVYEARAVIEPPMAKACAERRTPAQLADLKTCVELAEAAIEEGDLNMISSYFTRFHQLVIDGSGNITLQVLAGMLVKIVEKHMAAEMGAKRSPVERAADNGRAVRAYRKLVSLIEDKDGDGAEAFWRRHMEVAGTAMLRDYGKTTVVELLN
jgi:GntR family transcriptional regulator, transcriptional repressor for pyruvate dehydrogenase complex